MSVLGKERRHLLCAPGLTAVLTDEGVLQFVFLEGLKTGFANYPQIAGAGAVGGSDPVKFLPPIPAPL